MAVTQKEIDGIKEFIHYQVEDAGASGVVVGLSGGIDSALTAKLCVDALGVDRVVGVILPYGFGDQATQDQDDGEMVAQWLGIKYYIADIECAANLMSNMIAPFSDRENANRTHLKQLTNANIKSRLRMVALYACANEKNLLVAGTTNKSEMLLGYATKYGDGGVDIEPIQDFFKTEVWEMSSMLDVPQKIIDRVPTAGLWDGQTDEGELGMSYQDIDAVLRNAIFSYNYSSSELDHFPDRMEAINKIRDLVHKNTHKRHSPPFYERPDDSALTFE